ncbi:MAG TPA: hypothetical protein PLH72_03570 [Vicinamibacterales bacterium]|nr:hypothetical protein [Vicinamibacterales bacterium]
MHHHGAGLRAVLAKDGLAPGDQDALVAGLLDSPANASGLTSREQALLAYAELLTLAPWTITPAHIQALRAAGCDDRAFHDACAIVSYFAFVNRIADGLGVELEG